MRAYFSRIFFAVLLSLSMIILNGQEKVETDAVLFRGVVISASSGLRLPDVNILRNREGLTASRSDGTFSFYAYRMDTLSFSSVGYKTLRFIVSDTVKNKEFVTGIYLQSDTVYIEEVVIIPGFRNLKVDMMNVRDVHDRKYENARNNLTIAAYQGRTGQGKLGDAAMNYEVLRQKQKIEAYEKGGIPSDKIAGINPIILIPAAYMLLKGRPGPPEAPEPSLSQSDIERLNNEYLKLRKSGKKISDTVSYQVIPSRK